MRKISAMISVIPLLLLLTSCVGEEPDNRAYVTAVGIDKSDKGFIYTIQFANPTKISGGASEEGGTGGQIVENIAVEAPTLYSAVKNANTIVSKTMSLSHAKVLVVSEELAREGLDEINDVISRNNDIRPDVYVAVAENSGKYIEEVKPAIELNPIKYYQLIYENRSGSAVPQNTAFDLYTSCKSGDIDCVLPLAGVAQTESKDSGSGESGGGKSGSEEESSENKSIKDARINEQGFENKTESYMAGQAGEKIKNKSQSLGMAVFKGDKYITKLGSTETELYNILTDKFKDNNITFYSESDSQRPITIRLEQTTAPEYKIDIENKKADIYIRLYGELLSASTDHRKDSTITETDKMSSAMVSSAAEKLINELYQNANADSLGIKRKIKNKFITNAAYEKYCEGFIPSEWSFKVYTDMDLKRTGMTYYY
ncbi:MAG: Ger(x)C family spore germination C-terminal domain-containing protein [Candidatus Ornithomonoglobus sp.]